MNWQNVILGAIMKEKGNCPPPPPPLPRQKMGGTPKKGVNCEEKILRAPIV